MRDLWGCNGDDVIGFLAQAGEVLADGLLRGLILLAAALVVTFLLKRHSAAARHMVLSCAMGGLLVLPLATLCLPAWPWPLLPERSAAPAPRVEAAPSFPAPAQRMETSPSLPVPAPVVETDLNPPRQAPELPAVSSLIPIAASFPAAQRPASDPTDDEAVRLPWACWLTLAWAAGALGAGIPLALGILAAGWQARSGRPAADALWFGAVREARRLVGVRVSVRLLMHPACRMPITWGILRHTIVLPLEAEDWPEEKRLMVLLHEFAHINRRDFLLHALARLALALHWPNPLAWMAVRWLRIEREQAADDAVLGAGFAASDYAGQLLAMARGIRRGSLASAAALPMARASRLERRVLAILDEALDRRPSGWRAWCGALVMVLAALLALAAIQPVVKAEPSNAEVSGQAAAGPAEETASDKAAAGPGEETASDKAVTEPAEEVAQEKWTLHFPEERSLGPLIDLDKLLRTSARARTRWWQVNMPGTGFAEAQGSVVAPVGMRAGLTLWPEAGDDLSALAALPPGAVERIWVYLGRLPRGTAGPILAAVAKTRGLKTLELRPCQGLTPEEVTCLGACPTLERLALGEFLHGPDSIAALGSIRSLRHLHCYELNNEELRALPAGLPLTELSFRAKVSEPLTRAEFAHLAEFSSLERLEIDGLYTDEALAALTPMPRLKHLALHLFFPGRFRQKRTYLTDEALAHIATLRSLEQLEVYTGRYTEEGVRSLAALPHLRKLSMTVPPELADLVASLNQPDADPAEEAALPLAEESMVAAPAEEAQEAAQGDRTLHFPDDRSLGPLVDLDKLMGTGAQAREKWWQVNVPKTGFAKAQGTVVVPAGIRAGLALAPEAGDDLSALAGLPRGAVERIWLSLRHLPRGTAEPVLAAVAKTPGLKALDLRPNPALTSEEMDCLGACPALERLSLFGYWHGYDSIAALGSIRSLRRLYIHDVNHEELQALPASLPLTELGFKAEILEPLSAEEFAHLAQFSSLERLEIVGRYPDEALAALTPMPNLKDLALYSLYQDSPFLSDEALAHIVKLRSLEEIDINVGRFTEEGVRSLAALPHLRKVSMWGHPELADLVKSLNRPDDKPAESKPPTSLPSASPSP